MTALAAGAKCVAIFRDAVDEGLISEDMWKPFVELLPFDRLEADLAPSELQALLRVIGVDVMPTDPVLSPRGTAVFDSLGYDFSYELPPSIGRAFLGADKTSLDRRAEAWTAALHASPTEMHSSLDIGRSIDSHRLIGQLDTFFHEAAESHPKASIFFVGYVD